MPLERASQRYLGSSRTSSSATSGRCEAPRISSMDSCRTSRHWSDSEPGSSRNDNKETETMKRIGYISITATLEAVSGLRVGGSDDMLQIGGTDLTVIRHPVTLQPYIPGSSLKGKLRSELEKKH